MLQALVVLTLLMADSVRLQPVPSVHLAPGKGHAAQRRDVQGHLKLSATTVSARNQPNPSLGCCDEGAIGGGNAGISCKSLACNHWHSLAALEPRALLLLSQTHLRRAQTEEVANSVGAVVTDAVGFQVCHSMIGSITSLIQLPSVQLISLKQHTLHMQHMQWRGPQPCFPWSCK
jgi:hypothetical protein